MPVKKKEEKSVQTDSKYIETLSDIDIRKFCPQKIFNILFINETDEQSSEILNTIIETSREFENISYLTFITYNDVLELIENCDKVTLPLVIKTILKYLAKKIKDCLQNQLTVPPTLLAKLMKLKLIEVMYMKYIKAVKRMQKRRRLALNLKALTDECWSPEHENISRSKISKKTDSRISVLKRENSKKFSVFARATNETNDFTTIAIETDDDLVIDDDIHHHVSFYIFYGFYDIELLRELIVNNKISIQAILKFTAPSDEENTNSNNKTIYSQFWNRINRYFDGPRRRIIFENTFLMTFTPTGQNFVHIFEELLYIIRNISDIKLQHLNYLRHMEISRNKEAYNYFPLECLTFYNNSLQKFPLELVKVPVILDTLLKQVCVSVDETFFASESASQHSYFESSTLQASRCTNPCSIAAFFKNKIRTPSLSNVRDKKSSFLTHEFDDLTVILNSYKKFGTLVYDTTLKMLKNVKPLRYFAEIEADYKDIVHKHDIDPSTKTVIRDKDIVLHFLYLFLFSCFEHREYLPRLVETELTKNLETYNQLDFINRLQPKIIEVLQEDDEVMEDNLYNTSAIEYFWKETLEPSVLLQQIFKAQQDYMYLDQKYSPETDTLLLQFSNRLDEFGMNTQLFEQTLLTPICLRDFCRYTTVEQWEWLENNKPPKYVRKCAIRETCQGAESVIDLNLFPEYRHLLETEVENELERDPTHVDLENEEITFEQLVEELKNYPPNSKIVKECLKSNKNDKFFVYDLGTRYFQINGAQTVFHSHDDVKLSVDNTRTMDEFPKCSATVDCRNNSLVLHSSKFYISEDYNFHMNLADGTVVSFVIAKSKKMKHSVKLSQKVTAEKGAKISATLSQKGKVIEERGEKVLSVDQNYFNALAKTRLLNEEFNSPKEISYNPPESILDRLKLAINSKVPIYKVYSNLSHVKKLRSEFEIPLSSIVKRVLHNAVQKEDTRGSFTKRYLSKSNKPESEVKQPFDTRFALPNGLYISFYPSKFKKNFMEVKQEFLCRTAPIEHEEFRLFTRDGYILIKKIDGYITVLKANGDMMNHEKLSTDFETVQKWNASPCHCKNIEDYKRRVSKILKRDTKYAGDVAVSRRAHFHTRKGYVGGDLITVINNHKVPYLKTTLLKFDGSRVSLESGKMTVKKLLYTTAESDFDTQEIHYERSDGFKSTIDKNGRQLVEFTDGTKIISTFHVAKDLVDGYVYVSLGFEFKHPSYATVAYNSDNTLEISLNNNVVFKKDIDWASLQIDDDIITTVDTNKVVFDKRCANCESTYVCEFNIRPLAIGDLILTDVFLHASDSYNKHFYSDFAGNCERVDGYVRGPVNAFNCNHYNKMSYKKLFVINRDLSAVTFWTDNAVITKKKATSQDVNNCFSEYDDAANPKVLVYKFKRMIYDHYPARFLYPRYPTDRKDLVYSTFCVVRRMMDVKTIEKFSEDLTGYLENTGNIANRFSKVLQKIVKVSEVYCQRNNESITEVKPVIVETENCICIQEKISIADKIKKWRKEYEKYRMLIRNFDVPCYFNSEFCKKWN